VLDRETRGIIAALPSREVREEVKGVEVGKRKVSPLQKWKRGGGRDFVEQKQ